MSLGLWFCLENLGNLFVKETFIWQWGTFIWDEGSFIWQGGTFIWQEGTFILRRVTILLQIIRGTKFWSCVRTLSRINQVIWSLNGKNQLESFSPGAADTKIMGSQVISVLYPYLFMDASFQQLKNNPFIFFLGKITEFSSLFLSQWALIFIHVLKLRLSRLPVYINSLICAIAMLLW